MPLQGFCSLTQNRILWQRSCDLLLLSKRTCNWLRPRTQFFIITILKSIITFTWKHYNAANYPISYHILSRCTVFISCADHFKHNRANHFLLLLVSSLMTSVVKFLETDTSLWAWDPKMITAHTLTPPHSTKYQCNSITPEVLIYQLI